MILGMGAVGLVIEEQDLALERGVSASVELVDSFYANSGYHATKMDKEDVSIRLDQFLRTVEVRHGISREQISNSCVYYSHETYTPPRGNAARAEIEALKNSFGKGAQNIIITNTKGMTAHPMGVGIEDVLLVRSLEQGKIPPVMNLETPEFSEMRYSKGESIECEYGLRFAAGFGSQFVYLLFRNLHEQAKYSDQYEEWLQEIGTGKTRGYLGKTFVLN
jgi:3-oxoacyl-(acyl-carrier-protein) synthase